MELPAPFHPWGEHLAVDLPGARAVFTTRRGGVSSGPYASLNLGRLTDDDPAAVERNRALLEAGAGVPMTQIRQVHGATVLRVEEAIRLGAAEPPEADGQATARPGMAPLVLVADCLPIAVAGGGAVAMLHAGWRGLAGGVIGEGVRALRELGAEGPIEAAIGPGAGPCCYEVGEEVHGVFASRDAHGDDGDHGDHGEDRDGRRFRQGRNLDLKAIARVQLEQAGVGAVHDVGLCTICSDPELLFSHRRDHGITGRQGGLAWLT